VASSWFLFFSYHNDARFSTHQRPPFLSTKLFHFRSTLYFACVIRRLAMSLVLTNKEPTERNQNCVRTELSSFQNWQRNQLSNGNFFDVLLTVHLSIFISVFNQLDAQNLFHNKFYFIPLHVSNTCALHVLYLYMPLHISSTCARNM